MSEDGLYRRDKLFWRRTRLQQGCGDLRVDLFTHFGGREHDYGRRAEFTEKVETGTIRQADI